jgi:hypothetical protein
MNEAPILSLRQLLEFGSIKWAYQGDGGQQSQPISYWLTDPGVKPYLDCVAQLYMGVNYLTIQVQVPDQNAYQGFFWDPLFAEVSEAPVLTLQKLLEFGSIKWKPEFMVGAGAPASLSHWLTDPGVKPYLDYLAGLHMEADTLSIRIRGPEGEGTLFSEVP